MGIFSEMSCKGKGGFLLSDILDNVERWHDLANAMPAHADIVLLDSHGNGLQGMADYLANHRGLDVIHLLSHGAAG